MMSTRTLALILCLLLSCVVVADAAKLRTPPGSFLTKPVSDINGLCQLIQQDKVTAARLTKHFGMSTGQLVSYLRENAKISVLTGARRYPEYFVSTSGRVQVHTKYLTKGARLIVAFDGAPIMDLRCGNPMTKKLPKPVAKVIPSIVEQVLPPPPPPVEEVAAVVEETPPPPIVEEPVSQVLALAPQEISFMPVVEKLGLLLPLVGVGALQGSNEENPPVPEPSSWILLLMGTAGIAGRRYLSQRRR